MAFAYAIGLAAFLTVLCFALKVAATCKPENDVCMTDKKSLSFDTGTLTP